VDKYRILRPKNKKNFEEALDDLIPEVRSYLDNEAAQGRGPVYLRFYLSDAQNQAGALRARLAGLDNISIVEQPPLDGSRVAALVRSSDYASDYLFHSIRLSEEEAAGLDSYGQGRLLFEKYLDIIRPMGLELRTHCIRTWIYVRDIDSNYAGLVKARNDVFAEEGLSFDTHYIASTGIGGASEIRSSVVSIDFLTEPGIQEADKVYLKALENLSPTHDYGVAFERGVKARGHIYISGTASIDSKGRILHEGDVLAQADRLLENIDALLKDGSASLSDVPYFVIYLRDISDYDRIDTYMQKRFPSVPRIILAARVCRPGWLVEMECEN